MKATAAAAICLLLAAGPATGRDVQVGDTEALGRAIAAARPGDVIGLAPGDYRIGRTATRGGGTAEAPITLRADELGSVRISVAAAEGFVVRHPHWVFENLVMTGGRGTEHAFHVVGGADATVIRRNRLVDFAASIKGNGFHYEGQAERAFPDDVLIEGNVIHNSAPLETEAPVTPVDVVGGRRWVVRDNFIADFAKIAGAYGAKSISYGAFLKGNSKDGVFERNLIVCEWRHAGGVRIGLSLGGGGSGPPGVCEEGTCSPEHVGGTIRNNVIMNCPADAGVYLNKAKDTRIFNNTIYNANGIDVRFPESSAEIRNNIVAGGIRSRDGGQFVAEANLVTGYALANWVPGGARYLKLRIEGQDAKYPNYVSGEHVRWAQGVVDWLAEQLGSSRFGRGDAKFEAWFLAPAQADFRLSDGSRIVDRGQALEAVRDDFCGRLRRSPPHDVGAIEYGPVACDVRSKLDEAAALSVRR